MTAPSHPPRQGSGFAVRLLPSLQDFAFLTPIIFIFGRMNGARALLGDADTGWHIRTGEWILRHGQVPTHDLYSFTRPDQPWYAWEWLTDILMALAHRAGGLPAVVLGSVLLICLTILLLFRLVYRKCGNAAAAYSITVLAAAGSAIHWLARPHLFTLLFVVIFYTVLEGRQHRRLWLLPALMVLWTNLHGGFFIGIVLIGAYAAGKWIGGNARSGNRFAMVAFACLAVSFVNPYTWHLHQHLIDYLGHPAYFQDIQEFQPISAQNPLAHFFEPMLFLAPPAALLCFWRRRYAVGILIAFWFHLALLASRNIPVFLFIAAPPIAEGMTECLRYARCALKSGWAGTLMGSAARLSSALDRVGVQLRWHLFSAAAVLLLAVRLFDAAPSAVYRAEFDPAVYPKAALTELHQDDRIFTDDEWGDYLIYAARSVRVFVDGRSDFYGPAFEKQYLDILRVRADWKKNLDAFRIDTVLARADTSLCGALRESPAWTAVHDDGVAVIFRRALPR